MRVYSIVAKEVESNMIGVVIHIVMMHILQGWCLSEVFGEVGCDIWERGSDSRKPERKTLQDSQSNYGDWVQRQFHFPCEEWILQERFIYFQNNTKLFFGINPTTLSGFFACLGQPHLTTSALAKWVNAELQLDEAENYSEECVRLWLHKCGFQVGKAHFYNVKYFKHWPLNFKG